MFHDPIVEEVRASRKAYVAQFDGDLSAMIADLRRLEQETRRRWVNHPAKRIEPRSIPAVDRLDAASGK